MFNEKALFDCLKKHSMSVQELAEKLDINRVTLYRKIAGESDFTRKEIQKCRDLFGGEVCEQFFLPLKLRKRNRGREVRG